MSNPVDNQVRRTPVCRKIYKGCDNIPSFPLLKPTQVHFILPPLYL